MCLNSHFLFPSRFYKRFCLWLSFQTVFLSVQTLTPLFHLTVPNCLVFFRLLNRKFNGDSKNVLKTVILLLQVGITGNFVPDCSFKLRFCQFKL